MNALNELANAVDLTPPVAPIAEQVRQLDASEPAHKAIVTALTIVPTAS
jgi:hypothetical protein